PSLLVAAFATAASELIRNNAARHLVILINISILRFDWIQLCGGQKCTAVAVAGYDAFQGFPHLPSGLHLVSVTPGITPSECAPGAASPHRPRLLCTRSATLDTTSAFRLNACS